MKIRSLATIGAFLLALSAQGQIYPEIFERTDTQKEIELGRMAYDQMLREGLLSRNEAYVNRVNRVFSQLLAAMPEKIYPYQVVVVGTSSVNATCLPGGYITIYEGLVSQLQSDDALAFVLAHEIGHGARRHWTRLIRKLQTDSFVSTLFSVATGVRIDTVPSQVLAHTRHHEREADAFGVEIYLRAGFNPTRVADLMRTIERLEPDRGGTPYYLRSHPPYRERIHDIEKKQAELLRGNTLPRPVEGTSPEIAVEAVFGTLPEVALGVNPRFPLEPGMEWEYQVKGAGGGSGYTVRVIGVAETKGGKVARLRLDLGSSRVEYQCLTTADGVWRRNRLESKDSPWVPEFMMPAIGAEPVKVGKWTFRALGNEDVETPLGKYAGALKVEAVDGARTLHLWFAEGIGLVRRLSTATSVEELLVRFRKG